ncbi:zinc finger protein CONSTANS-LIKE 13-like [Curcuma longa]|uniref:zinc finger protein CONSTANS-LIKE 13-like n=1 Tax=Curcuma longa TaxID=136217 RepID=UPI003D9DD42A
MGREEEAAEIGQANQGGGGGAGEKVGIDKESCDFCGNARAILFCRADAARLCFACDRHVHNANVVSSQHRRALLCDGCRSAPASILCASSPCRSILCSNCDFDAHRRSQPLHDRRPVDGFVGCPSAVELFELLGIGGDEKELLGGERDEVGDYLVEDASVWEAKPVLSLEDLIVPTTASHGFQAMGLPPLPKHRNSTFWKHKEELIWQIRELEKLEGCASQDQGFGEPVTESFSLVQEKEFESDYIGSAVSSSWIAATIPKNIMPECNQADEGQEVLSTLDLLNPCGEYSGSSSIVNLKSLNGAIEVDACPYRAADTVHSNEDSGPKDTVQLLAPQNLHELACPDRNSMISRYKEKRKTRRYDKLIRYESRKIRADSRPRIKGRFAKVNPNQ